MKRMNFRTFLQYSTYLGLGLPGLVLILFRNSSSVYVKSILITTGLSSSFYWFFIRQEKIKPSRENVVFVSGSDSGLGFTMALEAAKTLGFTVFAAVRNIKSEGALSLQEQCHNCNLYLIELDITSDQSIFNSVQVVDMFFDQHPNYNLWAFINNAGVMVFGEFEWQTSNLIKKQVDVNILGTMKLTNSFCPLIRKYSCRIINVISHCAINALPGLSVYGATKSAIAAWSNALSYELEKFGVKVIKFAPGSFIEQTNIMASHEEHKLEMENAMTGEQRLFYGEYFYRYHEYLNGFSKRKPSARINNDQLLLTFSDILLEKNPKRFYINESFHYKCYRYIFQYCPFFNISIFFMKRFMCMPDWDEF